jgi:hypothetical protein
MRFVRTNAEESLFADLRDAGVVTPDTINRIDEAMGRPEGTTLDEFLLAGADHIAEADWLYWLIRRHGCHRFGRVRRDPASPRIFPDTPSAELNLPYRTCADGSLLVAVLRPDLREATRERLEGRRLHWAAATLREVRDLRAAL